MKGVAAIKPEFLKPNRPEPEQSSNHEDDQETPKEDRKRKRGQNKRRPRDAKIGAPRLCGRISRGESCPFGEECKFSHDIDAYLALKEPDIGAKCYNFDTFGQCRFGLTCRFASGHKKETCGASCEANGVAALEKLAKVGELNTGEKVTEKGGTAVTKLIVGDNKLDFPANEQNHLDHDLRIALRKRTYDFARAKAVAQANTPATTEEQKGPELDPKSSEEVQKNGEDPCDPKDPNLVQDCESSSISQSLVSPKHDRKKPFDIVGKLYLAPLTTVGNLPFRRICVEFGADVTCGEMAMADCLINGQQSEWALVQRHASERCFGVQLCGNKAHLLGMATQLLNERAQVDFIDLNAGCPIDLVCSKGAGASLLTRQSRLGHILTTMADLSSVPITLKTRIGYDNNKPLAHKLAPKLAQWGVSLFTLHGRTRQQRYTKLADWDYMDFCGQETQKFGVPTFGVGDVLSWEDYNPVINRPGISGVMLARGALIKPWLFTEIKEQRHWDISAQERLDILRKYVNYGLEHWGSDQVGVDHTRRFLLEWMSFLHRYVPIGVLERVPIRINERPPAYVGRNDLETMMASKNCSDWIKITEMLLGPVSDGFRFLPKHKANSYSD